MAPRANTLLPLVALLTIFPALLSCHQFNDKFEPNPPQEVNVKYDNHPWEDVGGKRRLSSGKTAPMRIHADFSVLERDWASRPSDVAGAKKAVGAVTRYLNRLLKVIPVSGPLLINRPCTSAWSNGKCASTSPRICYSCGGKHVVTVPDSQLGGLKLYDGSGKVKQTFPAGSGIPNTDLMIWVIAQPCGCVGHVAWASTCLKDQFGRAVAGVVNMCTVADWSATVVVLLHELSHVLFMGGAINHFRDALGNIRRNPIQMVGSQAFLATPAVRQVARSHFGCATLIGAPLAEDKAHWSETFLHTEVVTPISSAGNSLSKFSLAAMQDSGWYQVDLNQADIFRFGAGAGCSFFQANQCSAFPKFWCTEKKDSCGFNAVGLGPCVDNPYMACKVVGRYSNIKPCTSKGMSWRCANLKRPNPSAACYPMECGSYDAGRNTYGSVTMTVGSKKVTCTRGEVGREKRMSKANGNAFDGTITCPDLDDFCIGPRPFGCLHGKSTPSGCMCQVGFKGPTCSAKDDALPGMAPAPTFGVAPTKKREKATGRPTPKPMNKPTAQGPATDCSAPASGSFQCQYAGTLNDCYFAANQGNVWGLIAGGFSQPNVMVKYCLKKRKKHDDTKVKVWSSAPCGRPMWDPKRAQDNAERQCAVASWMDARNGGKSSLVPVGMVTLGVLLLVCAMCCVVGMCVRKSFPKSDEATERTPLKV